MNFKKKKIDFEMVGYGYWKGLADHVGTKTAEECREHYHKVWLDGKSYPDP